jgi:AcrR family transcriptional regulator
LLDAAQSLLLVEGYAAVTARRVASRAGVSPQLVHYYFVSMDDLFVQLVRRGAAFGLEQLDRALTQPQPLRALWSLSTDPVTTVLSSEYVALAHHRKAIAAEVAASAATFRRAQRDALREALERHGASPGGIPLETLLLALEGIARVVAMERSVGNDTFHEEALQMVEETLVQLEGPPTI